MVERTDKPLLRTFEELDSEAVAGLLWKAEETTRGGLKRLIERHPVDAFRIIPQAYDSTGVFTTRYFEDRLPEKLREVRSDDVPISYVVIGIDDRKKINRSYGYDFGDGAIQNLAELIKNNFRWYERREKPTKPAQERRVNTERRKYAGKLDLIARVDNHKRLSGRGDYGDKFTLLLYGCDENNSRKAMERFLEIVRKDLKIKPGRRDIDITISVGIAQYIPGLTPQELIARANKALDSAKHLGKDRIEIYKPEL